MRFVLVFAVCGLVLTGSSLMTGGIALVALWPALNFLILAAIYGLDKPLWLGKQPSGRMSIAPVVVLAPYLLFSW